MPAELKFIESARMSSRFDIIEMPENVIVMNNQNFLQDIVNFTVSQQWIAEQAGIAIKASFD